MKLSDEELQLIENAARTAQLFGIENITIDESGVRGLNDARTVYMKQGDANLPTLSFDSLSITRVPLFVSRLDIAKTQEKFEADVSLHDDGWAMCVTFKGKGTKVEYRGSNPAKCRIPADLNDDRKTQVKINGDVIFLMQKGQAAMGAGAEMVKIISNDEVTFEFVDVNSDVFSYTFPDEAEALTTDNVTKFAHKYPSKLILTLFKQQPDGYFSVGGRIGTLSVEINGIDVYIIPQK